jgi:hypothetical protein
MAQPKELHRGDACPACGGVLEAARVPTDEEFRKAFDKENPVALPAHTDTAPPDVRNDRGELHICGRCGYKTRFPAEENGGGDASTARDPEAAANSRPANRGRGGPASAAGVSADDSDARAGRR